MTDCPECGMRDDDWFLCRREKCAVTVDAREIATLRERLAEVEGAVETKDRAIADLAKQLCEAEQANKRLREALDRINQRSSPNPTRTFDDATRDIEWITAEARRSLSAQHGGPE